MSTTTTPLQHRASTCNMCIETDMKKSYMNASMQARTDEWTIHRDVVKAGILRPLQRPASTWNMGSSNNLNRQIHERGKGT